MDPKAAFRRDLEQENAAWQAQIDRWESGAVRHHGIKWATGERYDRTPVLIAQNKRWIANNLAILTWAERNI
jgi:hypothetical protein